jgi:hypothetical protein
MKFLISLLFISSAFAQETMESFERQAIALNAISEDSLSMFNQDIYDAKSKSKKPLWNTDFKSGELKVSANPDLKISEVEGKQIYNLKDKSFLIKEKTKDGTRISTFVVDVFNSIQNYASMSVGPEGSEAITDCTSEGCIVYSAKTCSAMTKIGENLMKNDEKIKSCILTLGEANNAYIKFNQVQSEENKKYNDNGRAVFDNTYTVQDGLGIGNSFEPFAPDLKWTDSPTQKLRASIGEIHAIALKCKILFQKGVLKEAAVVKALKEIEEKTTKQ